MSNDTKTPAPLFLNKPHVSYLAARLAVFEKRLVFNRAQRALRKAVSSANSMEPELWGGRKARKNRIPQ